MNHLNVLGRRLGGMHPTLTTDNTPEIDLGGYRLTPNAVRFLERAMKANPDEIKALRKDIVDPKSGLDAVQKGALNILLQARGNENETSNMLPAARTRLMRRILTDLDRRNVESRKTGHWFASAFGQAGANRKMAADYATWVRTTGNLLRKSLEETVKQSEKRHREER